MKIKELLDKVTQSKAYLDWKKENEHAYLVHFFFLEDKPENWQIGFYNSDTKNMTTFSLQQGEITCASEKDIFQESSEKITPLDINDVTIDYDEIKTISEDFRKTNYKAELPIQKLLVLQNLKDHGQVWNITIFSRTFKTLNLKFDTKSGEVLHQELAKLFEFDDGKSLSEQSKNLEN